MTDTVEQRELHPAEIAKFEAEALKLKAEARKARAEAKAAELAAVVARIKTDDLLDKTAEEAVSDDQLRVYRFGSAVNDASSRACVARLNVWHRLDPYCPIEIIFNSPGGSVIDGMALFDQITAFSKRGKGTHKITIGCRGMAASMAGILLQAGDHRWIGPESYLLIHEISTGTHGKIGEIQDEVKLIEKMCERVVDIFVKRSKGKCRRKQFVNAWRRTDWWLDSASALALGFVDEIR